MSAVSSKSSDLNNSDLRAAEDAAHSWKPDTPPNFEWSFSPRQGREMAIEALKRKEFEEKIREIDDVCLQKKMLYYMQLIKQEASKGKFCIYLDVNNECCHLFKMLGYNCDRSGGRTCISWSPEPRDIGEDAHYDTKYGSEYYLEHLEKQREEERERIRKIRNAPPFFQNAGYPKKSI